MADLRDALKNAGLVDKKKARQLAHEEKVRKKKLGREGVEKERDEAAAARQASEKERRKADREREQRRAEAEKERERFAAISQLVRERALSERIGGPRRFHFVTRERKVPFLELSEEIGSALERGELAICEVPGAPSEEFVLLPAETARKLRAESSEHVLFWNDERA